MAVGGVGEKHFNSQHGQRDPRSELERKNRELPTNAPNHRREVQKLYSMIVVPQSESLGANLS